MAIDLVTTGQVVLRPIQVRSRSASRDGRKYRCLLSLISRSRLPLIVDRGPRTWVGSNSRAQLSH